MRQDLRRAISYFSIRGFSVRKGTCPMCGKTVFVKLSDYIWAIRCLRCRGSIAAMAMTIVLNRLRPDIASLSVYELSSRGAFFEFLKRNIKSMSFSEYFDDVKPGSFLDGVQCQDVQNLTYASESFDVCTSTEIFEHVPDDMMGFAEIYRVLKPSGIFLLTVPLNENEQTIERVKMKPNGELIYLLKPEYHDDRLRGIGRVLCFRDYGLDIVDRLMSVGFSKVDVIYTEDITGWGFVKPVIACHKE